MGAVDILYDTGGEIRTSSPPQSYPFLINMHIVTLKWPSVSIGARNATGLHST